MKTPEYLPPAMNNYDIKIDSSVRARQKIRKQKIEKELESDRLMTKRER